MLTQGDLHFALDTFQFSLDVQHAAGTRTSLCHGHGDAYGSAFICIDPRMIGNREHQRERELFSFSLWEKVARSDG